MNGSDLHSLKIALFWLCHNWDDDCERRPPTVAIPYGSRWVTLRIQLWTPQIGFAETLDMYGWKVERGWMSNALTNARLPNVIEDMIIAYAGSQYFDALIPLGTDSKFIDQVDKCSGKMNKSTLAATQKIIKMLADATGRRLTNARNKRKINKLISGMNAATYASLKLLAPNESSHSIDLKQYAIFYRILVTYFL